MNRENLATDEKRKIRVKVSKIKEKKDFAQELSEILANFSDSLALVGEIKENHLYFSGLEDLLERVDKEMFSTIAHFLEEAERNFESFLGDLEKEPNIFIGEEHPLLRNAQCGLILAPYKKGRDKGVLALLDSNRMNYEHNLSLLEYINEIID
jgi:transcriptional regulator of heat shock response